MAILIVLLKSNASSLTLNSAFKTVSFQIGQMSQGHSASFWVFFTKESVSFLYNEFQQVVLFFHELNVGLHGNTVDRSWRVSLFSEAK